MFVLAAANCKHVFERICLVASHVLGQMIGHVRVEAHDAIPPLPNVATRFQIGGLYNLNSNPRYSPPPTTTFFPLRFSILNLI